MRHSIPVSISMPPEVLEKIDNAREENESRSEAIRRLITTRQKIHLDGRERP